MDLFKDILGFVFFIIFFNISFILLIKTNKDYLDKINKKRIEKNKFILKKSYYIWMSSFSAYLALFFFLFPDNNILNQNSFFIELYINSSWAYD